jgi:predicted secreted protein
MSTYNGRNATVKYGTYTIAEFASWSLDLSNDEIDTTSFGSTWKKSDVGMRGWSLSVDGHYDPSDATGQAMIEAQWAAGNLVSTIKVYVDNTSYWVPDITTDVNAGGRVTTYTINQAHDAVAGVSFALSGSGPITFI